MHDDNVTLSCQKWLPRQDVLQSCCLRWADASYLASMTYLGDAWMPTDEPKHFHGPGRH